MGMDLALKAKLQKQRYHIVGDHGGVKICHWTKESLCATANATKANFTELQAIIVCKLPQLSTNAILLAPTVGVSLTWIRSS